MNPVQLQRMRTDEGFTKRVKRAGTDVAEHDSNRARGQLGNGCIALR